MRAYDSCDEGKGITAYPAPAAVVTAGATHAEAVLVDSHPESPRDVATHHTVDAAALRSCHLVHQLRGQDAPRDKVDVHLRDTAGRSVAVDRGNLSGPP